MRKVFVIALSVILLAGCDSKKALEVSSTDSYDVISKKTNLQDKREEKNYDTYTSMDELNSFNDMPIAKGYGGIDFRFSKDGKLCSLMMALDTTKGASNAKVSKLSNEMIDILEENGFDGVSDVDGFKSWSPTNANGIKRITTTFLTNKKESMTMLDIVIDNERFCDPKVMEQEKKGEWITRQSIDAIDDTKTDTAALLSGNKSLLLMCKNNDLVMIMGADEYLRTNTTEVAFRLDKNKAIISDWAVSKGGKSVIYRGDTKKLVREMIKSKELTARIETYNGSVISRFNLDKIDYATKDIVKACKVNEICEISTISQKNNTTFQKNNTAMVWTIQIATVSTRENAESFQKKLREYNYNAYIQLDNNLYRIYVGPFIQKTEALQVQKMIEKQFKAKVIISEYKPNKS